MTITRRIIKGSEISYAEGDENLRDLNERWGWVDYSDDAANSIDGTPIALLVADTHYQITNDGLGALTIKDHKIAAHGEIFDTATGFFDFTSLAVGDAVKLRFSCNLNVGGNNQEIGARLDFAVGGAFPFSLDIDHRTYKTMGVKPVMFERSWYIGSEEVRTRPAKLMMAADGTGTTVADLGFYIETKVRGQVLT